MVDVPSRELRNDTAGLLRRVESGEDITVTVSGRPVAKLVRPDPQQRPWMSRADLLDIMANHQTDPGLRPELDRLFKDTSDDPVPGE